MEYSLEETESGGFTLADSLGDKWCPYQAEDVRCGTWCAVFFMKKNNQGTNINLGCTQAPTIYING